MLINKQTTNLFILEMSLCQSTLSNGTKKNLTISIGILTYCVIALSSEYSKGVSNAQCCRQKKRIHLTFHCEYKPFARL